MILALLIFLAWGSYLNSLGYRLLNIEFFHKTRSFCPHCKTIIVWHDNLPILSWFILQGQCRSCKQPISWLYPFIEIITTIILVSLHQLIPFHYFPAYFIFFSALIVTIRTDFDEMLISRYVTLYLIPIAYTAALYHRLPISLLNAIIGSLCGYFLLWFTKKIFYIISGKDGLGQGDLELLAFIGAFTGPFGCWITLTIGSCIGTIFSLILMTIYKQKIIKIAFGPYLSIGAIIFVLFQNQISSYFCLA